MKNRKHKHITTKNNHSGGKVQKSKNHVIKPLTISYSTEEFQNNLVDMIRKDRSIIEINSKVWYEINLTNKCIQALDTEEDRNSQLNNYTQMGYKIVSKEPLNKFIHVKNNALSQFNCNRILLEKDMSIMPGYSLHQPLSELLSLVCGRILGQREYIILEVLSNDQWKLENDMNKYNL